jgi:hypothetical protein
MIKRPSIFHFLSIETEDVISIRALVTNTQDSSKIAQTFSLIPVLDKVINLNNGVFEKKNPSTPLQSLGLLSGHIYKIRIIGLDDAMGEVFNRIYESDNHGNFQIKVSKLNFKAKVTKLQIFEVGRCPGLEFLLGNFIPLSLFPPKKIIISDFDKTLVDTKYSTTKEVYRSLTRPLRDFPVVQESLLLFKKYIDQGMQPFILTASPHFYEDAMRDWLYQNSIFTAPIFLKDYRIILNPLDGDLTTKDLKTQGFYKLNQLITILLMTGIPDELVLMGDGFESDTIIYLTLATLLLDPIDPWSLWNKLKSEKAFKFNSPQNSKFLTKTYQLKNLVSSNSNKMKKIKIKIYIRCPNSNYFKNSPKKIKPPLPQVKVYPLNQLTHLVEFYEA